MSGDWLDGAELPSDTEAGLSLLLAQCPPGARMSTATKEVCVPSAQMHALYAVVRDGTEVDREVERLRLQHTVRVLKLPTHEDEQLILRASDYEALMSNSGVEGAALCAAALAQCTGVSVQRTELLQAMGGAQVMHGDIVEAHVRAGWLVPAARAAFCAAPDEAPDTEAAPDGWLWSVPHAGRVVYALVQCRAEVLAILYKQKFGRAPCHVIERTSSVRKSLRQGQLDLRHVLRDLEGKRLISRTETMTGVALELTPAGLQAASYAAQRGRKRRR